MTKSHIELYIYNGSCLGIEVASYHPTITLHPFLPPNPSCWWPIMFANFLRLFSFLFLWICIFVILLTSSISFFDFRPCWLHVLPRWDILTLNLTKRVIGQSTGGVYFATCHATNFTVSVQRWRQQQSPMEKYSVFLTLMAPLLHLDW